MRYTSSIKPPVLLKTILDICYFLLLISFLGSIVLLVWQASVEDPFFTFKIQEQVVTEFNFQVWTLIAFQMVWAGIFIYVINLFKKLIRSFFKPQLFTEFQISRLNLIGKLIILTSIGEAVVDFLSNLILAEKARLTFSIEGNFGSFWFTLGLGLFFVLLSKAFQNARSLREENDLTV